MKKIKRLLALMLSLTLAMLSLSVLAFAEETELVLGDVDGNGEIETVDARLILRAAAGIDAVNDELISRGDMDGDGILTVNDAVEAMLKVTGVGGVVIPDKNGDNILSDRIDDNPFIPLIAQKFNVDPEALVAIYSVPDSGTNYVLEFKGSGILGNKAPYKKSADNLKKVYTIGMIPEGGTDSDRPIAYTNGKLIAGDHYNCDAAEGVLVFNIVQTMVIDQHPDYFE